MDVTLDLARFVADSRLDDIPESIRDESVRALVDSLACALGGCVDPALDTILDALQVSYGPTQATLIGRGDRVDMLAAALASAVGSSSLDYDAIHVATEAHASAPVAGALLALGEARGSSGAAVVHAFILGVETACRIGLALGAAHRERGWDAGSTCGVIGAAAACAKLLELDAGATAWAIGIAATEASGIDEISMSSSPGLNLGFAARNGVLAALLAQRGFTSSSQALEGKRGLLQVLGVQPRVEAVTEAWGARWELARIAYKPYPCSMLLHPAIDACLQLRRQHGLRPRAIAGIDLRVHPRALDPAGRRDPTGAVESRTSIRHAAAVALLDGAAGVRQFQNERVRHARVAELRQRVEVLADPDLGRDAAHVTVAMRDGRSFERHVRCALGSLERPLSDADLSTKFRDLATEVLATSQAERMLALAWNIRALADVGSLIRASVPEEELEPAELPGSPLIPR